MQFDYTGSSQLPTVVIRTSLLSSYVDSVSTDQITLRKDAMRWGAWAAAARTHTPACCYDPDNGS